MSDFVTFQVETNGQAKKNKTLHKVHEKASAE